MPACSAVSRPRPSAAPPVLGRETLACLETAEAMGFVEPLDPLVGALFHRVIGTLVRLIEPRR